MAKYNYPAIFTKENTGYSIAFPDVPGCYTSAGELGVALLMANDVLSLVLADMEDDGDLIPAATSINQIKTGKNEDVYLIPCDTDEYRALYLIDKISELSTH